MKILYTWTGIRELEDAKKDYPEGNDLFDEHINGLGIKGKFDKNRKGCVRRALSENSYDKLIVLVDYRDAGARDSEQEVRFRDAYKASFFEFKLEVEVVSVVIKDPEDYAEVYQTAKKVLDDTATAPGTELHFLLSSGTYPMTLCWILLGKTLFEGASFLREQGEDLIAFDVPLDLTVDYIPKKLGEQDRIFQELYEGFEDIIGKSALMKKARDDAHKAALHDVNILLVGESGTGKERFAEAIRRGSPRKDKKHAEINCAAIPDALLEDMLFGHRKGAYTGANADKKGIFEEVDGGTLFLDEIEACSPNMQAKLLRVLQPPSGKPLTYREYYPVGSEIPKHSDVRIIAASNRNLAEMARGNPGENGSFRSDLLYRLSAIVIHLPALRERREDILHTAEVLLEKTNEQLKSTPGYANKRFDPKTRNFILNYSWPGNVRELSNAILRGAIMSGHNTILPEDLGIAPTDISAGLGQEEDAPDTTHGIDIDAHLRAELRKWVQMAMDNTKSKKEAAAWLGLKSPQALDSKLKTLGMKYRRG